MLKKEKFIEILNFIKKQHNLEDEFCSVLEKMSPGSYVDAFIYSEYEQQLLDLLQVAMELPEDNDDISYFMYDLDYGKLYMPGTIKDAKGNNIDFSDAEKLYDYLSTEYKK